jgi:hypothetical protein
MLDWLRIIGIGALALLPSVGGILIAIFVTHHKEDALRGGAIGTAMALIFMFINRNYGMKLYDAAVDLADMEKEAADRKSTAENVAPAPAKPALTLEQKVETLQSAIVVDGGELKKLNWCLALTTAIAAFVCAFGDMIAGHYIGASHCQ